MAPRRTMRQVESMAEILLTREYIVCILTTFPSAVFLVDLNR